MFLSIRPLATVTMFSCAAALVGCGSDTQTKPAAGSPPGISAPRVAAETDDHSGGPALSAEDKALADAQKFCPVTDEELGSHDMGAPVKLIVNGEPIFICCKGCEKKVTADPDKYLAKVAELKKANRSGESSKN
jgi:hypothetical protein